MSFVNFGYIWPRRAHFQGLARCVPELGGHGSIIGPRGICRECGDVCLKHCETWTEISSKSILNVSDAISTCIDHGLGWISVPVFVGASAGHESIGV